MSLTITLKPETEAKLKNRAVALGCEVGDYVENLIEKELDKPKTLDEIFAPVRREFEESGMTEDELDDLIYQARREVYAEKKAKENKWKSAPFLIAILFCKPRWTKKVRRESVSALLKKKSLNFFVSRDVLAEIENVIKRPQIRERFETLTDEKIEAFLKSISELAVIVENVPEVFSLPRDIDDEIYINLAVECEADYLVTRDKDLIDLMGGYDFESKQFRQRFRTLKIVKPLEFLRIVEEEIRKSTALKP